MRKKKLFHGKKMLAGLLAAAMLFGGMEVPAGSMAQAAGQSGQALTVDLTDTTGDILHGASGFLYGISSEEVPTNNTMVPLKPKVLCTKGALGTEHPYGDALDVAESFFESGGQQVMMYNSNYYGVFGVTANHKEYAQVLKDTIAPEVVKWKNAWKKNHAHDNLSAIDIDKALIYIPINEGTPKNDTGFNQAWEAYYDAIKEGDPAATIAGPNSAAYNTQFTNEYDKTVNMRSHIQYCADNDCMADIITWHDLQTDKLERLDWEIKDFKDIWNTTDWTQYKQDHPEKFAGGAGVPELPQICINEYADFPECGVPGRLVNWIGRLEDQKIYGCLPFWHQANNLNDLTADANQGNGAWWLFKWYGDMSGQTVKVSTSTSYEKLYGVAAVDDVKKISTTLLGGVDGRADVKLLHVNQTGAFKNAKKVHVKVESSAFSGYHGAKEGTVTILEGTFPVNDDGSVILTLDNMKFSTAYNVTLTEAGEGEEVSDPLVSAYQKVYEAEEAELGRNCSIKVTGDYNPQYYISADRLVHMPQGAEMTYKFDVPVDGKYRLDFIYGNATGTERNDMGRHRPQNINQTFSLDGGKASELVMENTLLGSMTGIKTQYADLVAGTHTVKIKTVGNGSITHDSLTVTWYGAKDQTVKTVNQRYEAEHADFNILMSNKDTKVRTETVLGGYSSNGYVTGLEARSVKQGGGIRWNVVVAESGLYNLAFRYQSAVSGNLNLYIGNTATTLKEPDTRIALKKTGNAWGTSEVSVYLQKGINIVDVDTTRAAALDYMQVRQVPARYNRLHETVIEAEDCIPAGSSIKTASSTGASSGRYVVGMEGSADAESDVNKYLEIKYRAPSAGIYQMRIFQSNNDICGTHWYNTKIIDKYASVKVNSQEAKRYFFINTFSDDTFKEKSIPVQLQEGDNTIRIYNDDSWHVKWGGTTALPGENDLDNFAPNFDKFVLMPFIPEDTIVLPEEYSIALAATGGGFATADKNSVKPGGEYTVTAVPDNGNQLTKVLVNGEDITQKAVKNQDNSFTIKVTNVQADMKVQIHFDGASKEYQDKYVKNAGFGAGTTDKWQAENVTVRKSAADSYEGYYAVLGAGSRLSQTISLPQGKYALSVYSKGLGSVSGTVALKVAGASVDAVASQEYQENKLAFLMASDGEVTIEADASGLTAGTVLFDNFAVEDIGRDASLVSKKNIYQVDCGDYNPDTLGKGEKFGKYNHVTDQVYQEDIRTGKRWGVVTSEKDPAIANQNSRGGAGVYTKYQWALETLSGDTAKTESFRYAHGQDTAGINPRYVKYRFQVEPGNYDVTVGMGCNSWDNAHNPDVYVGESGNAGTDTKLNAQALNIPKDGNKEVQGTVTVQGEDLYVYALSQEPTIQMNYINIAKAKSAEEEVTSLAITAAPEKTEYFQGEDLDTRGLLVTAAYKDGTSAQVDLEDCVLEGFDSTKLGEQTITVNYTENGKTVQADFKVTVQKKRAEQTDNPNLIYFVDCGDFDPETASEEDRIGRYQSTTDRIYGKDPQTQKSWGVAVSDEDPAIGIPKEAAAGSAAAYTTYQWANERLTEDVAKTASFRYAHGQDTANINPRYVKYRFEAEPGEYKVTVGMGNSWNNAANPDVYAGVGNYETDMKLNQAALDIPQNGVSEAKGKVKVPEGQPLEVYALSEDATLQMNYIYIEKAGMQALKLEKLILTPPAKTVYSLGEPLDLSGMSVKAVYDDGTQVELLEKDYTVEGFDSRRAGGQMVTISYTNGATVTADFAVSVRAAKLSGLQLVSAPYKTKYLLNEAQKLNTDGLKLNAVYSDGRKESLSVAECDITGFAGNKPGKQTITVSYTEGRTAVSVKFTVEVSNSTKPAKYKVTYHVNKGGKVSGMPSDKKSYTEGQKATVKGTPVSKTKFFAGWNTKANGKGKSYAAGKQISIKGNVHLYAQWKSAYTAKDKLKYKVTGKKVVSCCGTSNKRASVIKVPATVKYNGITYKVTSVSAKAFANNKKIKKVIIGNHVKTIKAHAFVNCKNLKNITIGTGLTGIEKYAFSGERKGCVLVIKSKRLKTVKTAINHRTKNMKVKVPGSKLKAYKKLFGKKAKNIKVTAR